MKNNTHPQWYPDAQVTCACGNAFTTGATFSEVQVDICSQCHPFFTGEMKFVDRQGRVDKFRQKQTSASDVQRGGKKARKLKKQQDDSSQKSISSFKEILQDQRKSV